MSKIDEKYITALDTFTESLEQIVELLKEQQKNKVDAVNDFLKLPMDNLVEVVKDLKNVTQKGFADLKEDNKTILKNIESIKQQKESGMFSNIEDPKNKNKIVDGIKIIILIAGGVLAIGMAFKIIGKVDFLSVVALSTAIYLMATAFSNIADIKNLSYGKVFMVTSILPVMSFGLLLSAYLLQYFPTIDPIQGISMLLVSAALGVATYLLISSISKLQPKHLLMIPFIPFILPLIALGLVAASYILKNIQSITFRQVIDVALVGLALGVATIALSFALRSMKNVTWKEMLMLPFMIPLIAGGLVLASWIFKGFIPLDDPLGLLIGSAAIGLSILLFMPAIWVINKVGLKETIKGSFGILFVAGAILGAALILSDLPDNMKYPPFMWSLGTGISLLVFGLLAAGIGWIASKVPAFWEGLIAIVAVAGTIWAISRIINYGKYDNYPSIDWLKGVGLSVAAFAVVGGVIGLIILATGGAAAGALALGLLAIIGIAGSMLAVDKILNFGTFKKYPSEEWAKGVAKSMTLFTGLNGAKGIGGSIIGAISGIIKGVGGAIISDTMIPVAKAMLEVDKIFNQGSFDKVPSTKYVDNLTYFVAAISLSVDKWEPNLKEAKDFSSAIEVIIPALGVLSKIPNVNDSLSKNMKIISDSLSLLIAGVDSFMYESRGGLIGGFNKFAGTRTKRNMSDFNNFSSGLINIASAIQVLSTLKPMQSNVLTGFGQFLDYFKSMPDLKELDSKSSSIVKLSNSLLLLAASLTAVNSNLEGFTNLSRGMFLISVIDDTKFNNVLKSIDKYKGTLQVINQIPEEQTNLLSVIKGLYETMSIKSNKDVESKDVLNTEKVIDKETKKFYDDISEIKSILNEFKYSINKPPKAGSFYGQ